MIKLKIIELKMLTNFSLKEPKCWPKKPNFWQKIALIIINNEWNGWKNDVDLILIHSNLNYQIKNY